MDYISEASQCVKVPGVVVHDFVVRLHQTLVTRLAGVVNHGHPHQLTAQGRVHHLAVHGVHLASVLLLLHLVQAGHEAGHVGVVLSLSDVTC